MWLYGHQSYIVAFSTRHWYNWYTWYTINKKLDKLNLSFNLLSNTKRIKRKKNKLLIILRNCSSRQLNKGNSRAKWKIALRDWLVLCSFFHPLPKKPSAAPPNRNPESRIAKVSQSFWFCSPLSWAINSWQIF